MERIGELARGLCLSRKGAEPEVKPLVRVKKNEGQLVRAADAAALRRTFGRDGSGVLGVFSPRRQEECCRDLRQVHCGKAPTLLEISELFGRELAESWVGLHLFDLSEFSGCRGKLTPDKVAELGRLIVGRYGHYRLTELMLFFVRFKQCEYGRFYGTVDPMVIMGALQDFARQRLRVLEQRREEAEREVQNRENALYEEMRADYGRRVPGAFTPSAVMSYVQYRMLGYYAMPDDVLEAELRLIADGSKRLPQTLDEICRARASAQAGDAGAPEGSV